MGPPGTGPPIRGDPDMYVDCPGGGGHRKVKTLAFHLKKIASQALGGRIFVSRLAASLFFLLAASPLKAAPSDSVDITININVSSMPANTVDLVATQGSSLGTISLSWSEPGDNGLSGTASYYTIKVSTITNISDDLEFSAARPLSDFSPTPLFTPGPGGSIRSEVVTGLTVGDTYYFAIRATDNESPPNTNSWNRTGGNNSSNFAVAPGPPANITDLLALPDSQEGTIQLTWTQPGDDAFTGNASSYTVRISTIANINDDTEFTAARLLSDFSPSPIPSPGMPRTQASIALTGLQPGVTYYFALRASDDDMPSRSSLWSRASGLNPNNFSAAADLSPSTPTGLAAVISQGQITLNWNANPENDIELYRIYRDSTTPEDNYSFYASVIATTFVDPSLTVGNTYYYRISAVDRGPNVLESARTNPVSVLYTITPPATPTGLEVVARSTNSLVWAWQDNATNESGYRVKTGTGGILSSALSANTTFYMETGLGLNMAYTRYVEVFMDLLIANSSATTRYTLANSPVALAITTFTVNSSTLAWDTNANPANTFYYMERSVNGGSFAGIGQGVLTNTHNDTGLVEGSTYSYRVYARNGDSLATGFSNIVTLVVPRTPPADTTPPRIIASSPAPEFGSASPTNVLPDVSVTLTFTEPMDVSSLAGAFSLRGVRTNMGAQSDQVVAGTIQYDGVLLTFHPAVPLMRNYTYKLAVSTQATDLAGNFLAEPFGLEFRTVFDHTVDNVFYGSDGKTSVRIPAGALPKNGYVRMAMNPMQVSYGALSSTIKEATEKATRGGKYSPLIETMREFQVVSLSGEDMSASLAKPAEITIPYVSNDNDGFVANNTSRIHERFLGIVGLNETARLWVIIPGSSIDTVNKTVMVRVPHFSVYAIMPVATSFVGDAFAYPVPYVPSQGHGKITFTNLALVTEINIYTISGELVRQLHETDGDGQLEWDVENINGEDVFSGVYIYIVKSGSEKKAGKLVIIR